MWPSLQHPSKDPQKTVAAAVQNLQHGGDTVVLQSNTLQRGQWPAIQDLRKKRSMEPARKRREDYLMKMEAPSVSYIKYNPIADQC